MEKEDRIVGCICAAHRTSNETLDVEANQQLEHLVKIVKLTCRESEYIAIDNLSAWKTSVHVLSPQAPTTSRRSNSILTHSNRTSYDTLVCRSSRVPKSIGVVPDSCCVWSYREWSPVIEWNCDVAIEISQDVFILKEEVATEHEVLALGCHTRLSDVIQSEGIFVEFDQGIVSCPVDGISCHS